MRKQVVLIGAGISGLTCAYRLKQKGCDVLLVEREDSVGGVMKSEMRDGVLTESGPNSFQNAPEIMQLIEEVGLNDELVTAPASAPRYIYYKGRLQEFPMNPPKFFSTPLLTPWGKIRVFLEPFARPAWQNEESIADFITRRFGREVLEVFVDPFVSGVYAGDPARLCVKSTFPMLIDFEKQYGGVLKGFIKSQKNSSEPRPKRLLCSFKRGLGTLPPRLAELLGDSLVTNAIIAGLNASGPNGAPRFMLEINQNGCTKAVEADAVVLATPAFVAAETVKSLSEPLARILASIEYPPLASVCLGYDKTAIPRPIEGFGFLVPRSQGLRLLGCLWSSGLFPGRAPEGKVCLTNFVGGATDPAVRELSNAELIQTVHRELQMTLGVKADPHVVAIHRYPRAIPQYNLGHQAKRQQIEEHVSHIPGLFLTGNYLRGVSVGDCVREATSAAGDVAQSLRRRARV
ncbi:MAG: protoporphyrinogen oxidase [Acidobacteria bacterium]|nr:protoporphyrinogen oxidase [Acidobacteriota bacterium]